MGEVVGDAEVGARVQGARLGREAEATRRDEAVEREVVEAAAVRHGQPAPGADAAQHAAAQRHVLLQQLLEEQARLVHRA